MQTALMGKSHMSKKLFWRVLVIVASLALQIAIIVAIFVSLRQPAPRSITFTAVPGDTTACRIVTIKPLTEAWLKRIQPGTIVHREDNSSLPMHCDTLSGSIRIQTPVQHSYLHPGDQSPLLYVSATPPSLDLTTIILMSILTIIFDVAGIAVFLRAQNRPTAYVTFGLFYAISLMFNLSIVYGYDYLWINTLTFALTMIVRGLSTTFVCLFPRPINELSKQQRTRLLPYAPFAIGILLVLAFPVAFLLPQGQFIILLAFIYNLACLVVVIWILFWGLRGVNKNERQLARMVVLGVVFLLFPLALALNIVQFNIAGQVSLTRLLAVPLLALPIAFDYALFRHQLLGTTSLISRQVIRVLLWLTLASLFIFPAIIVLRSLESMGVVQGEALNYIYAGILVFSLWLFPFVWQRVRDAGDQVLYHDFYQYNRSLHDLSAALTRLQGLDQICSFLLPHLTALLNASDIALLVRSLQQEENITPAMRSDTRFQQRWHIYRQTTSVKQLSHERLLGVAQLALTHIQGTDNKPLLLDGMLLLGLYDGERLTGFLCLGPKQNVEPYSKQDMSFLATLVAQLSVLEVNNRYLSQAQDDAQKLSALNHRVISAQEDERKHLALELHDEALQQAMLLVRQMSDASTMTEVADVMPLARSVVSSLRRTCLELRPPLLDELGLEEALHWLARDTEKHSKLSIQILCKGSVETRPSPAIELALYRVVQEALSNVVKHANAHSVVIRLHQRPCGESSLLIRDDGRGIQRKSPLAERLGLVSMHERMESIGGHIHIRTSPGQGVTLRATYQHSNETSQKMTRQQEALI